MQVHEMTPKQFYKKFINDLYAEVKLDYTKAELVRIYPFKNVFHNEYYPALLQAAREGKRIPDRILDKLTPAERYRFLHDYQDLYSDYLPPEVRQQKKEIYRRVKNVRHTT